MTFHEIRFPTTIAFHSTGGPERKTEIVTLGSGFEERNGVWLHSRRRYDVGYGIKTLDDIHAVIAFFEARAGRLYGFRFKDFADFKSCAPQTAATPRDQTLGTGDGTTKSFALKKTYASGPTGWTRAIVKPVAGTVRVAVGGVETSAFALDATTGVVTLTTAPATGAAVTAGFEFDVPVRFDTDALAINLAGFRTGEIPSIPLVEIRV
ncbi:DUF2460 domain-containing protein [Rhizomicrobium electricum]|uniref:DUF2460 domain-containing protein n=1 Tax=Rhizomicrobium electricum TaxID=480070 RepID=A0ABP3PKV8_9PROT|nr:DUF2460 domain-containing protein [Rhizomicrobium electricum]NIJ48437.1 uncharacterized protein (TIGR02217 family) [Rhizomicrobium electricum]